MTEPTRETVSGMIFAVAEARPNHPALIVDDRVITYSAIAQRMCATSSFLREARVQENDVVMVAAGHPADAAQLMLGVMATAVASPIDSHMGDAGWARVTDLLHPVAIIGSRPALEVHDVRELPIWDSATVLEHASDCAGERDAVHPESSAVILATSGTTGRPRYVARSHQMLLSGYRSRGSRVDAHAKTRVLSTSPAHSAQLLATTLSALLGGGTVIFPAQADSRMPTPEAIMQAWRLHHPTRIVGSPTMMQSLLRHGQGQSLPAIEEIIVSGSSISPQLVARLREAFGAEVVNGYGMTEAPGLAHSALVADDGDAQWLIPVYGREIAIIGADGIAVPAGVEGEIVTQGEHVFTEYIGEPEATAAVFTADGWFRTGDLGVFDGQGRFRITGRLKEVINRGGEMIAPADVEAVLVTYPGVAESVAFGVPDPLFGEGVVAAVVTEPGVTVDMRGLRRHLLERLPASRVPREIRVVAALPLTATDKVRRSALADWHAAGYPELRRGHPLH